MSEHDSLHRHAPVTPPLHSSADAAASAPLHHLLPKAIPHRDAEVSYGRSWARSGSIGLGSALASSMCNPPWCLVLRS